MITTQASINCYVTKLLEESENTSNQVTIGFSLHIRPWYMISMPSVGQRKPIQYRNTFDTRLKIGLFIPDRAFIAQLKSLVKLLFL